MDPDLFNAAQRGDTDYLKQRISKDLLNLPSKPITSGEIVLNIDDPSETSLNLLNFISQPTVSEDTILHIATEFRRIEFAKLVVKLFPNMLWMKNSSGDTPLHIAAGLNYDLIDVFLSYEKTTPNVFGTDTALTRMLNFNNDTALHIAARAGDANCVERLVRADPKVCSFINKANESPLYLSIVSEKIDISPKIFLKNAAFLMFHKGRNGLTELHAAVLQHKYPLKWIVKLAEWRKEMIKEGDDEAMTPLHYAASNGKAEIVKSFIRIEPKAIHCKNNDGQTALYVAAFNGHVGVLEELIKCRPDCYNMVDNKGRTALHAAVLGNQLRVVKFIITTECICTLFLKVDSDGNTALHLAAHLKSFRIIKKLHWLGTGALNHDSLTPFDLFNKHFNKEDLQKIEGKKYAYIMEAYYYLGDPEGVGAKHRSVNSKLKMGNIEPTNIKDETTIRNELTKENGIRKEDFGEERALEVNLLVAMLVATVTFAAGFTVPGGLDDNGVDEGLANFTNKPIFKAFVFFNTLAFSCSILAVLIHFFTSLANHAARIYNKEVAAFFTTLAIIAMVIGFCLGTSIVLTKSTGLFWVPYCIIASVLILYPLCHKFNTWFKFKTFGRDLDVPLHLKEGLFTQTRKNQPRNQPVFEKIVDSSKDRNQPVFEKIVDSSKDRILWSILEPLRRKKSTWSFLKNLYKKSARCLRKYLYKKTDCCLPK